MSESAEVAAAAHPALAELAPEIDRDSPGLTAVIVRSADQARTIYAGLANLEWRIPIHPDTRFHCASLAKQFTALAVLQLRDRGRLRLDQSVTSLIPAVGLDPSITVRHLLAHTSGLRDQWPLMEWAGWRPRDITTTADVFHVCLRAAGPQFQPDTRTMYSNTGYTVLGAVVAHAADMPFADYVRCEIFNPLGMTDTFVAHDPVRLSSRRAEAYSFDSQTNRFISYTPRLYVEGSTSLVTTAEDYKQWMLAHMQASVWRQYIEEMQQPHALIGRARIARGFSYVLDVEQGQPVAFHAGEDLGFTSFFAHYPRQGAAVAIFTNASLHNLRHLAQRLLWNGDPAERRSPALRQTHARLSPQRHLEGDSGAALSCEGAYQSDLGEIRVVQRQGNELVVVCGSRRESLQPEVDRFITRSGDEYFFGEDAGRSVLEVVSRPQLGSRLWVKVGRRAGVAGSSDVVAGHYFSPHLSALIEAQLSTDGDLTLILPRQEAVVLERIGDGLYSGSGYWVRSHRTADGPVLSLSAPRCLDVEFRKCDDPASGICGLGSGAQIDISSP